MVAYPSCSTYAALVFSTKDLIAAAAQHLKEVWSALAMSSDADLRQDEKQIAETPEGHDIGELYHDGKYLSEYMSQPFDDEQKRAFLAEIKAALPDRLMVTVKLLNQQEMDCHDQVYRRTTILDLTEIQRKVDKETERFQAIGIPVKVGLSTTLWAAF